MADISLKGQVRNELGKAAARKLRRQRLIPAVVYGGTSGPVPVTINPLDLTKALGTGAGENVLIDLSLEGNGGRTTKVIVKELQRDPVRGGMLHADFLEISMKRRIRVQIPLQLVGEPVGIKTKGGFVEQHLREVTVECLPVAIPGQIQVEVSHLDIGDSIHVRDLSVAEEIKIVDDGARPVVSVLALAAVVEEEAPKVEEKPSEPEVVGKKEAREVKEGKEGAGKAEA